MKRIFILALALVFIIVSRGALAQSDYIIRSYDVRVEVAENAVYSVTETIDVFFQRPRHGIIRSIPVLYTNQKVKIEGISINHPFTTARDIVTVSYRIGDPDVYVNGDVRYVISYRYDVGEDNLPGYDQFYFNIIGTDWDAPIGTASFTVVFPKSFDEDKVWVHRGAYGQTGQTGLAYRVDGNTITGMASELRAFEGVTMRVELPEGYYVGARKNIDYSRIASLFAWLACLGLLAFGYVTWVKKGKDDILYPAVQFSPPEGMTPSDMGYIADGIVDNKDITALIFHWADKGFLLIEEQKAGRYDLVKLKEPEGLKSYEKHMFNALFKLGKDGRVGTKDLEQAFYKEIPPIKEMIKWDFQGDRALVTKESKRWSRLLLLLALVPTVLYILVVFANLPGPHMMIPMLIGLIFTAVTGTAIVHAARKWNIYSGFARISRIILALALGFLFFLVLMIFGLVVAEEYFTGMWGAAFIPMEALRTAVTTLLLLWMGGVTEKRSPYGHKQLEYVLGLREFIEKAEMDRLKALIDENPQYYYDILPYAIVLGLENKWSDKFKSLVTQPPDWYRGDYRGTFTTMVFVSHISRMSMNTTASMAMPKSSGTGMGGGGFSGGGMGGGGGRSW
ncbi:MAG: DUF2207 domain-containing protein [Clostridia bacterium]